jgi:hypothetical protein
MRIGHHKESTMYENQTRSTSEAHRAPSSVDVDTATRRTDTLSNDTRRNDTQRTDPKFVRESLTMRRMQPWQIAALAIAAAVVVGLALFYF